MNKYPILIALAKAHKCPERHEKRAGNAFAFSRLINQPVCRLLM